MAFGDDDLATMLSADDFGVSVQFGTTTTSGILDAYDERAMLSVPDLDFAYKVRVVTIQTGSLPGVVKESTVKVDGTNYKVRDVNIDPDGALTQLFVVTP